MKTKMDSLSFVWSQLATYYIANELNKIGVKAIVPPETGGPDILVGTDNWIEVGTSHPGELSVNLYQRKIKSFTKWKGKGLVVWLDMDISEIFAVSISSVLKKIETNQIASKPDLRNPGQVIYTIPKSEIATDIKTIAHYFGANTLTGE